MATNTNTLTRAYVKLREARAKLSKEYNDKDKDLKAKMSRLEAEMLRILKETGSESIRTEAGTFYRQEDITPSGSDWEAFYAWVAENSAFDALERRIKKTFVKEYMEAHDGELPPGVSVYREYVARVRQS